MRAAPERRRTGERDPARRPDPFAQKPAARVASVLELQRSAGNAAVAGLLQRAPTVAPPRPGGWNEKAQEVAGTIRIPVSGIKAGHQLEEADLGQTTEPAAGRAVVIIPRGLDVTQKVDTLLFFHGMWNAGYRERTTDHADRGKAGTVHDVEADRIPQQISAAGGKLVAVLPQGTNRARFGIADPRKYVDDVLGLATPDYQKQPGAAQLEGPIQAGQIIVGGHSGGGRAAFDATKKLESTTSVDEWLASPPMLLFDGINGTDELSVVARWAEQWLDADLALLRVASAASAVRKPRDLLKQRRLKLRSTFTAGGRYEALNTQGTYTDDNGNEVTVSAAQGLRGRIKTWFDTHGVDPTYRDELRAQYLVEGPVAGGHEQTVGTGRSPEREKQKRKAAPAGLTGPSKAAGVPDYSGGGNLEKALKLLYPPPPRPKSSALAEPMEEVLADA